MANKKLKQHPTSACFSAVIVGRFRLKRIPSSFFLLLTSSHTLALLYFIVVRIVIAFTILILSQTHTHTQTHCVWLAIIFDVFVFSSFCRIRFVCLIFSVGRTETRLSFKAAIQHVFILPLSACDGFVFSFYLFIYFFLQDLIPFHCYLHHKIPTSGCMYVTESMISVCVCVPVTTCNCRQLKQEQRNYAPANVCIQCDESIESDSRVRKPQSISRSTFISIIRFILHSIRANLFCYC